MDKDIQTYLKLNENKFTESTKQSIPSKLNTLISLGFNPEVCFNELKERGYSLYTIKVYFMTASRFETQIHGTSCFREWLQTNKALFRNAYARKSRMPVKTEIDSLISNVYYPKEFKNLVILMAYAGLRLSEALDLTWSQIKDQVIELKGKGGKIRRVPLSFKHLELLKSNYTSQKVAAVKIGTLRKLWQSLSLQFTPHDCRAFYISYLLNDLGFSVTEVRDLVGHSSITTTNLYARTNERELFEKVKRRVG